jgi:hypothetical protein
VVVSSVPVAQTNRKRVSEVVDEEKGKDEDDDDDDDDDEDEDDVDELRMGEMR